MNRNRNSLSRSLALAAAVSLGITASTGPAQADEPRLLIMELRACLMDGTTGALIGCETRRAPVVVPPGTPTAERFVPDPALGAGLSELLGQTRANENEAPAEAPRSRPLGDGGIDPAFADQLSPTLQAGAYAGIDSEDLLGSLESLPDGVDPALSDRLESLLAIRQQLGAEGGDLSDLAEALASAGIQQRVGEPLGGENAGEVVEILGGVKAAAEGDSTDELARSLLGSEKVQEKVETVEAARGFLKGLRGALSRKKDR